VNGHQDMPQIGFSEHADYDTMHSVLTDWCCRIWTTDGPILVAKWRGESETPDGDSGTSLLVWNAEMEDYMTPLIIPTDTIRKIEVL